MAKFSKDDVKLVMDYAKCDERTAKWCLKAAKGSFSQAAIAAKHDVEIRAIAKLGQPVTLAGLAEGF